MNIHKENPETFKFRWNKISQFICKEGHSIKKYNFISYLIGVTYLIKRGTLIEIYNSFMKSERSLVVLIQFYKVIDLFLWLSHVNTVYIVWGYCCKSFQIFSHKIQSRYYGLWLWFSYILANPKKIISIRPKSRKYIFNINFSYKKKAK